LPAFSATSTHETNWYDPNSLGDEPSALDLCKADKVHFLPNEPGSFSFCPTQGRASTVHLPYSIKGMKLHVAPPEAYSGRP